MAGLWTDKSTIERDERGCLQDPRMKIKFVNRVVINFYTTYTPKRCESIDEQMVAFKGRLSFKQYLPAKPTKWGMKAFVLSESNNGYGSDWLLSIGWKKASGDAADSQGTKKAVHLIKNLQPGHIIYMDNYNSSPELFSKLISREFRVVGIVCVNRHSLHLDMKALMKKTDPTKHRREGSMLAVAWFDKKRQSSIDNPCCQSQLTSPSEIAAPLEASATCANPNASETTTPTWAAWISAIS